MFSSTKYQCDLYDELEEAFDIPYRFDRLYREDVESCIFERYDFEELYECFNKLLPCNINKTRQEVIEQMQNEISKIYGEEFEYAEDILSKYYDTLNIENLEENIACNEEEIGCWQKVLNLDIQMDKEWISRYIQILELKRDAQEKIFYTFDNQLLEKEFGSLSEKKVKFLEQIKGKEFEEALELFRYYQSAYRSLDHKKEKSLFKGKQWKLHDYLEFYKLGSVFLSDYLNKVNKNKAKRKDINQEELDKAIIYFYETDDLESAEQLQKKEDYLCLITPRFIQKMQTYYG